MGLREFKVGTFCGDDRREEAENRTRFIKSDIGAYTLWYSNDWSGCVEYKIEAKSGKEAKKIAIEMRLRDEQHKVDLDGWGWWRNV